MGPSIKVNRLQRLILGADIVKLLQAQDTKVPVPESWRSGQGDDETTEYLPFTKPTDVSIELAYRYSSLGRVACEIIPKDTLRRWFTFVDESEEKQVLEQEPFTPEEFEETGDINNDKTKDFDKNLQKQLRDIRTPQNPNWGYRELKRQAMIWENLWGWSCIAFVPTSADQVETEITEMEGNRGENLDWIVFSKQHILEEIFNIEKRIHDQIPATLLPDAFLVELKSSLGWSFTQTVPMKNCIMYNFRPELDTWEGQPIMDPIFGPLIYLENILYGNTQAVWSQGMGNFCIEWPKATDLDALAVEFGSIGNKKMTHFHSGEKDLKDRIYNASLSGTIYNPTDLMKQNIDFVCGYLQIPPAVLFGTPQGALSSSWVQDINYETTLMNNQEEVTPQLKKFLEWALGYTGETAWNTGEIIDEGMRADARVKQLSYHTINEVREKDNLPPLPGGNVLLSEFNSRFAGINIRAEFDEPDNKGRKAETGEEAGTPAKEKPDLEEKRSS